MIRRIKTAEDLDWLLDHTRGFQGGRVTDLHASKRRLFDEASGHDVTAGTVITAVIRYELAVRGSDRLHAVTRVAKLTMTGVTDFSIFEQAGADFSEIVVTHAEVSDGRLRFWFDPFGELYVICDEAEIEEVSRPGAERPTARGMTDWAFQAQVGDPPAVAWLLDQLDRAGLPCVWRAVKPQAPLHPAVQWEGHLVPAAALAAPRASGVHVLTYGPLDGCGFGIALRAADPREDETGRLLVVLADLIARNFTGRCLAGDHIMDSEEWLWEPYTGRSARGPAGGPSPRSADPPAREVHDR